MAINIDRHRPHDILMATPRPNPVQKEERQLVTIKWTDIIQTADWTPPDEVTCPEILSVGWLISQDEKEIKIGNTIGEDDVPYGITAFPKGCVLEINFI